MMTLKYMTVKGNLTNKHKNKGGRKKKHFLGADPSPAKKVDLLLDKGKIYSACPEKPFFPHVP